MLKIGQKRRRTRTQIEQEREEAEAREQEVQHRLSQIEAIKEQKEELEKQISQLKQNPGPLLHELVNSGIAQADDEGNVFIPASSKKQQ